jgi:hypothetical protein
LKKQIQDYSQTTIQTGAVVIKRFQEISMPLLDWISIRLAEYKDPVGRWLSVTGAATWKLLQDVEKPAQKLLADARRLVEGASASVVTSLKDPAVWDSASKTVSLAQAQGHQLLGAIRDRLQKGVN